MVDDGVVADREGAFLAPEIRQWDEEIARLQKTEEEIGGIRVS